MMLKLRISGPKVHDVGFRAFILEATEDNSLQGFQARNIIENGQPVVVAHLSGEEKNLAEFRKIIEAERPSKAEVFAIAFENYEGPIEHIEVFASRFQARQLRKGISSIIRMEDKQDLMISKQDVMIQLQTKMLDKQDQMLDKQDQMLGKQDQMISKQDQMLVLQSRTIDKLDVTKEAIVNEIHVSSEAVIEELRDSRESTVEDIRDLRVDLRSSLDKKLSRMEKDIAQIKARSKP